MRISDWSSDVCSSDLWFEGEPGRDWYMAMGKVEGLLAGQGPGVDRSACFVCTLALAWPDGHAEVFEGRAAGSLTWPPRGKLGFGYDPVFRSEEHTSELQSLMRISYAVFCLKNKTLQTITIHSYTQL